MKYQESLANFRKDYQKSALEQSMMEKNPLHQFENWLNTAIASPINEANAMVLSSVDAQGSPSSRVVLLKGLSAEGFVFYTNYESRKGKNITDNPRVSLLFFWDILERQVRIEGIAQKLPFAVSQQYFQSRPKGSQIGAMASPQSQIIESRTILEQNQIILEQQYKNAEILPCPENWGGYLVQPHYFEFWQGRSNRLHDRFCYTLNPETATFDMDRLAP